MKYNRVHGCVPAGLCSMGRQSQKCTVGTTLGQLVDIYLFITENPIARAERWSCDDNFWATTQTAEGRWPPVPAEHQWNTCPTEERLHHLNVDKHPTLFTGRSWQPTILPWSQFNIERNGINWAWDGIAASEAQVFSELAKGRARATGQRVLSPHMMAVRGKEVPRNFTRRR